MSEQNIYQVLIAASFLIALAVFITLFFINAPYGRHKRSGWGISIPSKWGWMIMESPSVVFFAALFWFGDNPKNAVSLVFFVLWQLHYIHRALIYPWGLQNDDNKMPVSVMVMAFGFNLGNAYINGRYLFSLSAGYPLNWLFGPRFLFGVLLFAGGYSINRWADSVLLSLRKMEPKGYKIPQGGLYRWISCPNYFGEIIEWLGWAIATWSLPGLAFAVWTFANLAPRATAHHHWYYDQFPDYPLDRKALIPFIW